MLHEKSPRAIFTVWAIIVGLFAPIVILFVPITITQSLFYDPSQIVVLAPSKNHLLLTIGFVLIIGTLLLLAFRRSKQTYLASAFLVAGAIGFFAFSTLSYVIIHPEYITVRDYLDKQQYAMEDFEAVIYEYGLDEPGQYQFITKEGEAVIIQDSPQLHFEKRSAIYKTALAHDLTFEERPMQEE